MSLCLRCGQVEVGDDWQCPACRAKSREIYERERAQATESAIKCSKTEVVQ